MSKKLEGKTLTVALTAGIGLLLGIYAFGVAGLTAGEFLTGLIPAATVGISAIGLVMIYRTVRIINFAQSSLALVAMQLFYEFYTRGILPYPIAWPVGIIGGTLVAVIIGILASTLFFRHPRLTLTVVTVFMTGIVGIVSQEVASAFQKPGESIQVQPIPTPGTFFDNQIFQLGVTPIRLAHIVSFFAIALALLGLVIFFKRSRMGIAVRASAENADRASLLGINVKLLNIGVWAIVGLITSVAGIANMVTEPYVPGQVAPQTVLVLPLTAAVVAKMMSLPIAFLTGMGLVILRQSMFAQLGDGSLLDIITFGIVLVALLFQRHKVSRVDDSSSWKATREVRPTPRELLALPFIRRTRQSLIAIGALIVLAFPWVFGSENTGAMSAVWTGSILAVSLVILTGWTGQISLGHIAFLGTGAYIAGNLTSTGFPFLLALPIAGLAGAILAVLVGLPALRIRGLFLAVSSFALAIAFPTILFSDRFLASSVPTLIESPSILVFNLDDPRTQYYFSLLAFLIVAVMVRTLRNSRAGRLLIALRDNEQGVQAFGVDIVRTRLMAFAISGFLAAFAGGITVHLQRGMDPAFYNAQLSFGVFQLVIIGGVSSIAGAFLGTLYFVGGGILFPGVLGILTGVGGLALMMAIPGGLAQIVFGIRDAVLRVVALRRHIVVPSLFADYSPDAWEKRLTPLAPAVPSQGIGALRADQRYTLPSRLYGKVTV
ncbi:MAG: ABC transporter permease [Actinomycetota bacterium]